MSEPIRVSLVRSGGLAGIRRSVTLSTTALEPDRAAELRRLVGQARVSQISEPTIRSSRDADRFHYTLTVQHGGDSQSVTFAEEKTPDQLRDLLAMVWREGRPDPDDTQRV